MNKAMISERQIRPNAGGTARRRVPPYVATAAAEHRERRSISRPNLRQPQTLMGGIAVHEAVLKSGAGPKADKTTVTCLRSTVEMALSALGQTILAGTLDTKLEIDGALMALRGEWQSVCCHADADGEYLELQLLIEGVVRIDRQMFLSRRGHFAMLADAVNVPAPAKIDYRLELPAAGAAAMKFSSSVRECRIRAARAVARAFPLALPQDRVLSAAGSFVERNGRLELAQSGTGRALYAPVIFDWHPKRRAVAAEWRSLTVTEAGRAVGSDRAAGHRLRLGKHQLLIYKNLDGSSEARAVLGHHTRYETMIGMFNAKGDVAPLVLVDAS